MHVTAMKCKRMIIVFLLQRQILEQLHSSHMGIKKTGLLMTESVYCIHISVNIEQTVKQCTKCLEFQCTKTHETALHYEIPTIPWKVADADIFMVNNKILLCIAYYYSKFPVLKKVASLSAGDLVLLTKITFAEFELDRKIISDEGTNFTL